MRRSLCVLLLAGGCAAHRPHHTGFHFSGDVGYSAAHSRDRGADQRARGDGVDVAVAGGWAVLPDLVVGGQTWVAAFPAPDVDDGVSGAVDVQPGWAYSVVGVGPMVKYYLMPVNVFAAVTPSLVQVSVKDDQGAEKFGSEWGFGVRGNLGTEFFVGQRTALGFGLVGEVASGKGKAPGASKFKTLGVGLVFSVSVN